MEEEEWLWRGGTSPTPVKLFDEQEVARILEDQVRSHQEQMDCTLREVDEKYSEKEKTINEKLDSVHQKLADALAEITVKDNLVKQHIKVAEEAVIGWERADNEAAASKLELEVATQQKLATADRVQHLDGALKEVMNQLRNGREEQEQHIHETIVKKTQEYEKLRAEMESKLVEASLIASQSQAELVESRAENMALSHALQERSRALAEVSNTRARSETNIKVLQLRVEALDKENTDLKVDIRRATKELEARMSELEHGRKAVDVASRQHTEALKKVTKLDEECNRLRTLVRKKLPSNAAMVRLKQDVDSSGRDGGRSPRRRHLGRSQSGADHLWPHEENLQSSLEANASAEKILSLEEETRMLKEALAKRSDELQSARIMCAKTASRLSSVEEEVEALRLASKSAQVEKASSEKWASSASIILSESSPKTLPSNRDSLNFELMDDFEEMERLANFQSQSQSVSGSEHAIEAAVVFSAADETNYQRRIAELEEALEVKDRDLEAANQMCHELSTKLAVAEEQLAFLQSRNAANEQTIIDLQERVDSLLESQTELIERSSISADGELALAVQKLVNITEALAQATGTESAPFKSDQHDSSLNVSNSIVLSLQWQDPTLDTSMSSLLLGANTFLQTGANLLKFVLELTTTLECISILHIAAIEDMRKGRDVSAAERLAISMELESARVQVSQLEEELCRVRAEQADVERKIQVEMGRFPQFEAEITQLRKDKSELENNMSQMDLYLAEANDRVEGLRVRLSEAEVLVTELQTREAAHENEEKEEDLIERQLLELATPSPGLSTPSPRLAPNMPAADAEMHQLHDKVAALEVELHGERRRHQEVIAKLEDLQEQIHKGVGRLDHSPGRSNGEFLPPTFVEDDETKSARKEKEIAAAALAECQRTIIALGKQLKVLGLQEPSEAALSSPSSPDSIEKMTHTMESLRSQADSSAPIAAPGTSLTWGLRSARPALPGLYYRQNNNNGSGYKNGMNMPTDGPVLVSPEPDSSVPETLASPVSPARVLRSVRTIRGATSMVKAGNGNSMSTTVEGRSLESRRTTPSTFRLFYARSPSGTSMCSDLSNPGLV